MLIAEALTKEPISGHHQQSASRFSPSQNKETLQRSLRRLSVRHKTHSMHGTIAERSLTGISADLMFCQGLMVLMPTVVPPSMGIFRSAAYWPLPIALGDCRTGCQQVQSSRVQPVLPMEKITV